MRTISLAAILALATVPVAAQETGTTNNSVYKIQEEGLRTSAATEEKLRSALAEAGFQQVTVVDSALVVRAKTADGDDVTMYVERQPLAQQRTGARKPDRSIETDSIYTAEGDKPGGTDPSGSARDTER